MKKIVIYGKRSLALIVKNIVSSSPSLDTDLSVHESPSSDEAISLLTDVEGLPGGDNIPMRLLIVDLDMRDAVSMMGGAIAVGMPLIAVGCGVQDRSFADAFGAVFVETGSLCKQLTPHLQTHFGATAHAERKILVH